MRDGIFTLGFFCLFLGAWGLWMNFPAYQQIHSDAGRIAVLLDPQLLMRYNEIDRFLYASILGVIVGISFMVYGARGGTHSQVALPVQSEVKDGDITERMSKLKEIYDKGLITEVEYNKKKSEILSKF